MVPANWYGHLLDRDQRLYPRCLFCRASFQRSSLFDRVPPGNRFAYDPATGRIWSICTRCRRWSLIPIEERFEAIEELERVVRDVGVCVAATANIALFHADDLELVRIGSARDVERAVWRYGRRLAAHAPAAGRRHRGLGLVTAGAIARVGESVGAWKLEGDWGPRGIVDVLRWQRFGSVAWNGRSGCPFCGSVLHTLHFDSSWWLHPRMEEGRLVVGVPCTRCDPWSTSKVFDVTGEDADVLLRRALAYQNVTGADERTIAHATQIILGAGSAELFVTRLSTGRSSLWRLGPLQNLALEIAANHLAERRALEPWLLGMAAEWRAQDELARIIDDEL
jgi:hypothetical protein